jgi:hypothetical protein
VNNNENGTPGEKLRTGMQTSKSISWRRKNLLIYSFYMQNPDMSREKRNFSNRL